MTDCDRIRIELGGYVLDGLEPDEAKAVEAHLDVCERCRAELAELAELPPLLAAVRRSAPSSAPSSTSPPAPPDLRHRVLGRPWRRRRQIPALVAGILVVAAALSGALAAIVVDGPPPPDAVVTLQGAQPVGIVGEAQFLQVASGVRLELDLVGVRAADEGYYHAWMEREGRRVSAGTFVGTDDGVARVQLLCGGRLDDYDRVTVTWHAFDRDDEVVAVEAEL